MILYIHSDASYLSERESKSRAGGFFYMGNSTDTANKLTNGAILIISTVLKHVMYSTAEAERSSPSHNIGRIRASSAPHTIGNRQHHCHRIHKWHNKTKTHKSNGNVFLLDKKQSKKRAIQGVLGPRIPKFGRLFHKTPFAGASQKNARNIYTCK
jgi:hypothetical protein